MAAEGQREKALAWAAAATGGALAAAGVYWAGKKALDYYVPYQVCVQMPGWCCCCCCCLRPLQGTCLSMLHVTAC
jgi:hypothetical protein